jgi:sugar (pentulose or hexulose) kinase
MTADACNCPVLAGPIEATAIGNVMVQAIACGDVETISAARQIVRQSCGIQQYEPCSPELWSEPIEVMKRICA